MPKKVDHQARRSLIAGALLRIAADRGLEEVSLRHVAAEAGVSPGMVQHYFGTKEEMMTFALDIVSENVQARAAVEHPELELSTAPGDLLRALLVQLLPFDEQRTAEGRAALAFMAYAAIRPAFAARLRAGNVQMCEHVAGLIGRAQSAGSAPGDLDAEHAAAGLLALMDGLGFQVLSGYYSPEAALDVFDTHVRRLLGG